MRNVQRRLNALEQLLQFQPPPSPLQQIWQRALQPMSDADLEQMMTMARDRDAGVCRTPSESEAAVLAVYEAALETEARRMGFRSMAEAERRGGWAR
jgi:hypothetical protein